MAIKAAAINGAQRSEWEPVASQRTKLRLKESLSLARLLLEQRLELGAGRRRFGGLYSIAGGEILAEVGPFLVHHAFGGGLAALVVVGGIVMPAVAAHVQRPVAGGTGRTELDAFTRIDLSRAVPALHGPKLLRSDSP